MRCELSPQAVADLQEIGDYITRDNPQRVASFVADLLAHSQRIAEQPEAFPARPELVEGIRSAAHQRFVVFSHERHVMFFTASPEQVLIERIIHTARDIANEIFLTQEQ